MVIDNETGEIVEGNDAHSRHQRIVGLRQSVERTFLDLGMELYYFEELKQYREVGYDTFEAYLASPEVEIERRTAFMIKGVYQTFIKELGVQPVALLPAGYSKLEIIRSRVTSDNVEGLLADAVTLSRSDLIEKMGQTKHSKVSSTTRTKLPAPMTADERIAANAALFGGSAQGDGLLVGPKYMGLARDFKGKWEQWLKTGAINKDSDVIITVQIKRKGE